MKNFLVLVAFLLTACASGPTPQRVAYDNYVSSNEARAESGAIKWSTYYEGLYSHGAAANAPAYVLKANIEMIDHARDYEAGKITKPEFQQNRRRVKVESQAQYESELAVWEAERYRRAQAAAQVSATARANAPAPYMMSTNQTRQSSYPQYQQSQQQQTGAMAFWTGKSEIVQTVTNQSGWECQYQYNGQYFTRVFVGSTCPSSVQVQ